MNQNDFPETLKLGKNSSTIVRFLFTDVQKIEGQKVHENKWGDTSRFKFKCSGGGCPACAAGINLAEKVYLRVYDYADGKVKVWERNETTTMSDMIQNISDMAEAMEKRICDCVFELKSEQQGDGPVKYSASPKKPNEFPLPDSVQLDVPVAKLFSRSLNKEDMESFVKTGVMPPKKPYNPNGNNTGTNTTPTTNVAQSTPAVAQDGFVTVGADDDLPF